MGILILLMIIVHTGRNNLSIGLIIYALYKIVKDKLEGVTIMLLVNADRMSEETPNIDAVEVVRCKDCKFYHTEECAMDDWHFAETKENDFCSFGQKKEKARDNG